MFNHLYGKFECNIYNYEHEIYKFICANNNPK